MIQQEQTMKVNLSEIPEEGLTVSEEMDPVKLNLDTPELKFVTPVKVTATFQRERQTVLVEVGASGQLEEICGRCLKPYAESYDSRFHLDYPVKEELVLDVTDDIRQEILLSYPVRFLCREDCRGLCSRCGTNLNEGGCVHGSS